MKGLIALDIDGTLTVQGEPIPYEVVSFLTQLAHDQWQLLFITGRTYQWGHSVLSQLPFSYYLSVQNGAITLEMPSKKILIKKYLNKNIIPLMQTICQGEPTDFVIYAGFEYDDLCYYRPHHFDKDLREYLIHRSAKIGERWEAIQNFERLHLDEFPSVKCFGRHPSASLIAARIEEKLGLHVPLVRDPFDDQFFVVQATHPEVTKGYALKHLKTLLGHDRLTIAAGDDYNDIPMLEQADIRVVMATAPSEMRKEAHIIAPAAKEKGIIAGLLSAVGP